MQVNTGRAGAILRIDLQALRANYQILKTQLGSAACGAAVKADAYGLGAAEAAPAVSGRLSSLFRCASGRGIVLRPLLPADAMIIVMHGSPVGCEADLLANGLTPVLNSLQQIAAWNALATDKQTRLPAFVQFDTGMARMGLSPAEVDVLRAEPQRFAAIDVQYVMSHLVSAEDQVNPVNREQLEKFRALRALFPAAKATLANSSGIFLGKDFHFDLARPGAALYGVAPVAGQANLCAQSPTCRAALFRHAIFRRIPGSVTAVPGAATVRHVSRRWRSAMPMAGYAVSVTVARYKSQVTTWQWSAMYRWIRSRWMSQACRTTYWRKAHWWICCQIS
jgi:alanine racemase